MKARALILGTVVALWLIPALVEARITRIDFTRVESPTFGGAEFGAAGKFEKLVGVATGEVDPSHPLNAIIQDIDLAPRNARGMVEYSTDIYIIKPVDMARGNGLMLPRLRGHAGPPRLLQARAA